MTVKEFYEKTGGDYAGTLARFLTEERMARFALKFASDPSYEELLSALSKGDKQEAFRAAHTLKGVCQNLGFSALYEPAHRVTEELRAGNDVNESDLEELKELYAQTLEAVRALERG